MRVSKLPVILIICLIGYSVPVWSSDFRSSKWGATVREVMETEKAELTKQEKTELGWHVMRYTSDMLGQSMEVAYFFDPKCTRLIGGSFSFEEPLSERQYLMIIWTFNNIHGEGISSNRLNGGGTTKWQGDDSEIQFRHWPNDNEIPEFKDFAPTQVTYLSLAGEPSSCDKITPTDPKRTLLEAEKNHNADTSFTGLN